LDGIIHNRDGNSFAAFPVIATGVLAPLISSLRRQAGDVAIITLTAGSSGTLMTPMAANFNIVPAAPSQHAGSVRCDQSFSCRLLDYLVAPRDPDVADDQAVLASSRSNLVHADQTPPIE